MDPEDKGIRPPRQEALFEDARDASASALVTLAACERPLNAAQQAFNRLTERVRRARENLAAWEAFIARFQGRVARELQPVEDKLRAAQRALVRRLDELLADSKGERLSRKQRAKASSLLLEVIDNLLQDGPDPELEALYERHGEVSHAERRRHEVELAEMLVGEIFGPEVTQGHEARDLEALLRHADGKIDEARSRERSSGRARRGGAGRAAERKAQAAREASLSVREIYRKLASALHPDRETLAAERDRKTVLMQRVNQAYERNDLLELLALQIETEQIDAAMLGSVPEARLRHYNQVLLDQARTLEAEVAERAALFRAEFDLSARDVTPQVAEQALSLRITRARATAERIEREAQKLADPRQRRSVLDALPEPEADGPDLEELAALAAAFGRPPRTARPNERRRRRRRR